MNTNLNIDDFGVLLADATNDSLGFDYSVEYKEIIKNNGVIYHALMIRKSGDKVAPTIYIDELYRDYLKGKKVKALSESIVKFYHNGNQGREINVDFYRDFSKVSEHLGFKVVSFERNMANLVDVPYRLVEDLAMIPICSINNGCIGSGNITIHRKHLKIWEISEEELWENIFESAAKVYPVKVISISEFVSEQTGIPMDECLESIYVITNKEMVNAAAAAFYPGVLREVSEKLGSDLVLIPSSVHETIVMPSYMANTSEFTIAGMIREVNENVVSDEEILSDNAYYYDRAADALSIFEE